MPKVKSPPLRRVRLDGRGWLALSALAVGWMLLLRGWPLIGHPVRMALGRWIQPGVGSDTLFGAMTVTDVLARYSLYAFETAVVGLLGWIGFALIARESPLRLLTDAPRFRLKLLGFGLFAAAAAILAQRAYMAVTAGASMELGWGVGGLGVQALWAVGLLGLTLMIGFFEEALFRGGLLRLAARSPWLVPLALIANAALFSWVHGAQTPVQFVDRFALGMALGWATVRLRGVELAIGLHAGFDFAAMLLHPGLLELPPGYVPTPGPAGHAAAPTFALLPELVAGAVMATIFSLIALVLTEIVIRVAGGLGLDGREAAPSDPEAWDPEPAALPSDLLQGDDPWQAEFCPIPEPVLLRDRK